MRRAVILFDNDCGFCRWSLSKLLAWDRHGRLRPIALQREQADDLLVGMDRERKMASWHLVAPNGRTYSGGGAVPQLARLLPAGAPIAALTSAFPRTTDRAYRWVARHRERLGRVLGERACDPTERDSYPPNSAESRVSIRGGRSSAIARWRLLLGEVPEFEVRAYGLIGNVEIMG